MADWGSMSDTDLVNFINDPAKVEAETAGQRDKLQEEWCKRTGQKWTLPDGSVAYQPPGWIGGKDDERPGGGMP